jgi:hypothetical protein
MEARAMDVESRVSSSAGSKENTKHTRACLSAHLPGAQCAAPRTDASMDSEDSLAALQGLHRDLCAHIDLQLPVLERLITNLEAHLEALKTLLDKKPQSDASRRALAAGTAANHARELH